MCGGSKSTTPPPSPPPTTFSYTAADKSNTAQRQAAVIGSTGATPTLGSDLGTGAAAPSAGTTGMGG